MRGRAGRKGKDEIGETYLCCQKSDLEAVAELMEAELPSVESCLVPGKRGIKRCGKQSYSAYIEMHFISHGRISTNIVARALLEVIATQLATSDESIDDYIKKTLLYHSIDRDELATMTKSTMNELLENKLITNSDSSSYEATLLGKAVVTASLTPEDGLFVHRELQRALDAFVLDGELHAFYSFTPVQNAGLTINVSDTHFLLTRRIYSPNLLLW